MRVSRLAAWFMAGAVCLAGASIAWPNYVSAANGAKSSKAAKPEVGNPANDTCLACHGNEGFAALT
jgi:cytochrome c553